jgi:hypothetical protein
LTGCETLGSVASSVDISLVSAKRVRLTTNSTNLPMVQNSGLRQKGKRQGIAIRVVRLPTWHAESNPAYSKVLFRYSKPC